jgi:hypothetical protein
MFKDARIEFNIVFPLAPTLKYLNISVRRLVLIIMKYGLQNLRKHNTDQSAVVDKELSMVLMLIEHTHFLQA